MAKQTGSNNSGRRKVRTDLEALQGALPNGMVVIRLGDMYCAIMLALIEEFQATNRPVSQGKRDEIIARYSRSDGATIMGQLRRKGAVESASEGTTHQADVVPRFKDVIYLNSRFGTVVWPLTHKGKTPRQLARVPKPNKGTDDRPVLKQIGEGSYVLPPDTKPLVLRGARLKVYLLLIEHQRTTGHLFIHPNVIRTIVTRAGLRHTASVTNVFDHTYVVFIRVSGKRASVKNPCLRALVIRPCLDAQGKLWVPKECEMQREMQREMQTQPAAPVARTIRSKGELEEELAVVSLRLKNVVDVRDQIIRSQQTREEELRATIEHLTEELARMKEELAVHLKKSRDGDLRVNELTSAIATDGQKRDQLATLINNYNEVVGLLTGKA